jgi:hypothetical protein
METSDALAALGGHLGDQRTWEARLAEWVGLEAGAVTITPGQHASLLAYLTGEAPL